MSDMNTDEPKRDDQIIFPEKPKGLPRFGINAFTVVIVVVLTLVIVVVMLALIGPLLGTVYSSCCNEL